MMNVNPITIEEKETIRSYIRGGKSVKEIMQLTGRSHQPIYNIRNSMTEEIEEIPEVKAETPVEVVSTEKPEPVQKMVSDCRDDPRWQLNIDIRRIIKIEGKKTGYRYSVSDGPDKDLHIINDLGQEFTMEMRTIEKFIDELIDISIEVNKLLK